MYLTTLGCSRRNWPQREETMKGHIRERFTRPLGHRAEHACRTGSEAPAQNGTRSRDEARSADKSAPA